MMYRTFKDGWDAGFVEIHPTVARIAKRDGIEAWVNIEATEPRWEAYCEGNIWTLTFADDPNTAILDCATKVRYSRMRLRP
jgi:hypothetical protein